MEGLFRFSLKWEKNHKTVFIFVGSLDEYYTNNNLENIEMFNIYVYVYHSHSTCSQLRTTLPARWLWPSHQGQGRSWFPSCQRQSIPTPDLCLVMSPTCCPVWTSTTRNSTSPQQQLIVQQGPSILRTAHLTDPWWQTWGRWCSTSAPPSQWRCLEDWRPPAPGDNRNSSNTDNGEVCWGWSTPVPVCPWGSCRRA